MPGLREQLVTAYSAANQCRAVSEIILQLTVKSIWLIDNPKKPSSHVLNLWLRRHEHQQRLDDARFTFINTFGEPVRQYVVSAQRNDHSITIGTTALRTYADAAAELGQLVADWLCGLDQFFDEFDRLEARHEFARFLMLWPGPGELVEKQKQAASWLNDVGLWLDIELENALQSLAAPCAEHRDHSLPAGETRKEKGLRLWNEGKTWTEVACELDGTGDTAGAVKAEIKRFAKTTDSDIRRDTQGRKPKN
ncbi:MAG: hypothetical protein ACTHK7_21655 [Aureliella sp.]